MKKTMVILVFTLLSCQGAAQGQSNPFTLKPAQLAGEWTVSDTNPSGGCRIILEVSNSPFGYPANVFGCTADDLLNITRWSLSNTSVVLSSDDGAPVAVLKIRDRNRFQGRSPTGRRIIMSR